MLFPTIENMYPFKLIMRLYIFPENSDHLFGELRCLILMTFHCVSFLWTIMYDSNFVNSLNLGIKAKE